MSDFGTNFWVKGEISDNMAGLEFNLLNCSAKGIKSSAVASGTFLDFLSEVSDIVGVEAHILFFFYLTASLLFLLTQSQCPSPPDMTQTCNLMAKASKP